MLPLVSPGSASIAARSSQSVRWNAALCRMRGDVRWRGRGCGVRQCVGAGWWAIGGGGAGASVRECVLECVGERGERNAGARGALGVCVVLL